MPLESINIIDSSYPNTPIVKTRHSLNASAKLNVITTSYLNKVLLLWFASRPVPDTSFSLL